MENWKGLIEYAQSADPRISSRITMIDPPVGTVDTPFLRERARRVLPRLLEVEEPLESAQNQHRI